MWMLRQSLSLTLGVFFGFAMVTTVFAQSSVTIEASKDNTLYEDVAGATSNGAGENFFVGRSNQLTGSIRRGLISFNLVGQIPSNATITSVTLTLSMSRSNPGEQTVNVHRVLADWGEGSSNANANEGGGALAATNDATWLHRFFSSAVWSSPGATYAAAASASQTIGTIGSYSWGSTSALVSDVQAWLNTPSSNFGWVLIGNEAAAGNAKRFDTRENATSVNRPRLTVVYTTTSGVSETTPEKFALHQNYPNPFNPATTIAFELANRSHASLKIFNLLGQEMASLVNAVLPAGVHTVQWNAPEMSSGIYVYRLEADGSVATRKLVLAR